MKHPAVQMRAPHVLSWKPVLSYLIEGVPAKQRLDYIITVSSFISVWWLQCLAADGHQSEAE
jgi:hypothetical protein